MASTSLAQQLLLVLTIGGVLDAMDEVMSSVECQIPDELCKGTAINTSTKDYAAIVVVAASSDQGL